MCVEKRQGSLVAHVDFTPEGPNYSVPRQQQEPLGPQVSRWKANRNHRCMIPRVVPVDASC
jgi:hypothetical protein